MDLGENEEHFSATARLQKEFFVERAVQHEGRSHIPIAAYLAKPGIFLTGKRIHNLYQLVSAPRPEIHREPVSSLTHLRFTPEIVEFQNQVCIVRGRFLCHILLPREVFLKSDMSPRFVLRIVSLSGFRNVRSCAFKGALVIALLIRASDYRSVLA